VYVVAENVQHDGAVTYDDDRDGTPERSEPSTGMAAFQLTIEYDPAIVAVSGVEPGPDLERTGRAFQCLPPNQKTGSLTYGCISTGPSTQGAQGTMTLASIELLPQGPGLSLLSLDAVLAGPLGDGVSVAISGGAARVSGTVQATATGIAPTSSGSPPASETPASTRTPAPGTASPPATSRRTDQAPATPTGGPDEGGGGPFGGVALWLFVVAGGLGAGLLGLGTMLWRERRRRGT